MARATDALTLLYSGGAGNTNPELSIGGIVSSAANKDVLSQTWTPSTITGITIVYATRNALGAGYLSYTASNNSLTWLTFAGASSTIALAGSGKAAVGNPITGFLTVDVSAGALPLSDTGQSIVIGNALDTVFGPPSASEILNGATEYRCFYLKNRSTADAVDVVATLTTSTPQSTVTMGSSFAPLSSYGTTGAEWYTFRGLNLATGRPALTKSLSALTPRERLTLTNQDGTPRFPFYPSAGSQVSDGVAVDVDVFLQDKYDTTNLLNAVEWGATLAWSSIPAGKMVSLWLRRVMPANPVIPTAENIGLDFQLILT